MAAQHLVTLGMAILICMQNFDMMSCTVLGTVFGEQSRGRPPKEVMRVKCSACRRYKSMQYVANFVAIGQIVDGIWRFIDFKMAVAAILDLLYACWTIRKRFSLSLSSSKFV